LCEYVHGVTEEKLVGILVIGQKARKYQ